MAPIDIVTLNPVTASAIGVALLLMGCVLGGAFISCLRGCFMDASRQGGASPQYKYSQELRSKQEDPDLQMTDLADVPHRF